MPINEQFSNRWGIILASLGMAIGAGNLWRFPRLAGQYGGTFLILWIAFLLLWSIPILLAEFSIGKKFKQGVIASFAGAAGKQFTWMGFFITLCTLGITFYYSVVTAWGLRYVGFSLSNLSSELFGSSTLSEQLQENPRFLENYWEDISSGNILTVFFHVIAVVIGCLLLYRGIQKGLERANKILIPLLFVMMILISLVALNIGNGLKGVEYMFHINPQLFAEPKVWIEAISQSAWSTGAGWGLILTISSYSRDQEDVTLNIFISGFGNNASSLLAGLAILPAVFALSATEASAIASLQSGNQALIFNIIPQLFSEIPGGTYLTVLFFTAFTLAAFSSLLPMIELFIKTLGDFGFERHASTIRAGIFCILFGLPSAWSLNFFSNQDWVWGIGLIISGLFIVFAVLRNGIQSFKRNYIDSDSDFTVNPHYFSFCMLLNIPLGLILIYWWMSQGYDQYPWLDENGYWNFSGIYSNATILTQWLLILFIGAIFNGWLYRKSKLDRNSI